MTAAETFIDDLGIPAEPERVKAARQERREPEQEFLAALTALGVPLFVAPPTGGDNYRRPNGWQDFTADGNTARLADRQPGYAVMAVCGGLLVVVDVDPRNGGDADKMRQLLAHLGVRVFAEVETPGTDKTGRHGVHFYIAGHPDIQTSHNPTGYPGVDVQAAGANVYLPGTLRAKYDGKGYRVIGDSNLGALIDGGDPDGAEAFAWWLADHRLTKADRDISEPSPPWDGTPPDKRQDEYLTAALSGECADLERVPPHSGRNNALNRSAFKMGRYIAGAGLDERMVVDALTAASTTNGLLADGPAQVAATIRSGLLGGKKHPKAVPAEKNGTTWDEPGSDGQTRRQTAWDATDLLNQQFPEEKWVVVELIPAGLTVLSGPPKQGKSWMALRLGTVTATGNQFLGRTTNKGRVLFLALEDGARRAQKRLRMMPEHTDLVPGIMEIRTAAPTLDDGLIAELEKWRTRDSEHHPRLVVIDVFQRIRSAGAGKDRYAEDYAGAAGLQQWANLHGIAVVILHHNRKPVQGDDDPFMAVSGSTGLTGAVDQVMVIRGSRGSPEAALFTSGRDVEQQEVSLRLTNGGLWEFGTMPIELVTLPNRCRWDRDVWRYLAQEGQLPTQIIADHFKLSADAALKRLRRVEDAGWITSDGKGSKRSPVFWEAATDPTSP